MDNSNNGNRRRKRKRYRVRYDRIICVAVVLVVLILLLTSCVKGCTKKNKNSDESQSTTFVDELTTEKPAVVTTPDGQAVTDSAGAIATQAPAAQQQAPEYTTQQMEYSKIYNGDLVLINTLNAYKFQEDDISLVTIYDNKNEYYAASDLVISLDANVVTQLNALMAAYATASGNTDLRIIGGYRTLEAQNDKYNNGNSRFQGGYSDYHSGRSFDIGIFPPTGSSGYYKPEGSYAWLDENAASYGFILRFPSGKDSVTGEESRTYTYRYVGVPHAVYMKQNGLCLEEYTEQIKSYTQSAPLSVTSGSSVYQVYYVPATQNGTTDVPVPSNLPYTVSGNNSDGFIVTVTVSQ